MNNFLSAILNVVGCLFVAYFISEISYWDERKFPILVKNFTKPKPGKFTMFVFICIIFITIFVVIAAIHVALMITDYLLYSL